MWSQNHEACSLRGTALQHKHSIHNRLPFRTTCILVLSHERLFSIWPFLRTKIFFVPLILLILICCQYRDCSAWCKWQDFAQAGWPGFDLQQAQTGSENHPASKVMGTGCSFSGLKQPERKTDHSYPSSGGFKNAWSSISSCLYAFMAWCLIKRKDNFHISCL